MFWCVSEEEEEAASEGVTNREVCFEGLSEGVLVTR
jgi:hypothetical protein